MVSPNGFEPLTFSLRGNCSTAELWALHFKCKYTFEPFNLKSDLLYHAMAWQVHLPLSYGPVVHVYFNTN